MGALVKKKDKATLSNTLNEMFFPERNTMTLQELRFIMLYLAKINPSEPDKTEISFTLEEYSNLLGVELNEKAIANTTRRLLGYVVDIKEKSEEKNADGEFEILADQVQIFKRSKLLRRKSDNKFFLTFECHEELKEHIFKLKNEFTTIEVWNIINLRNFQDARMYMLLRQYRKPGVRVIEIDELKEMLGIDKNAYPEYKIFVRDVLKKCQKALKERTDLCFDFKAIGRPAHSVQFTIFKNDTYTPPLFLTKVEEAERAQLDGLTEGNPNYEQVGEYNAAQNQEVAEDKPKMFKTPHEYDDSLTGYLATVCNFEFNQDEMIAIISAMNEKLIREYGCSDETFEKAQHDFLVSKYKALKTREAMKKAEGETITKRFSYLIGIINHSEAWTVKKDDFDINDFFEN